MTTESERKTYTSDELREILDKHGKWRRGEAGGARANLARADLADADLADAYLARAYLAGANLAGAYLAGAYLAGANLADADLAGANLADAYLADANLADADLADANLADADLADANLARAKNVPADAGNGATGEAPLGRAQSRAERAARYREAHPEVPFVPNLDAKILEVIESGKGELDMGSWHSCATTHCRAGWAITLAGEAGKALEEKYDPERAGAMIYRASTGRVPWFFASDAAALEDIRRCATKQSAEASSPSAEARP